MSHIPYIGSRPLPGKTVSWCIPENLRGLHKINMKLTISIYGNGGFVPSKIINMAHLICDGMIMRKFGINEEYTFNESGGACEVLYNTYVDLQNGLKFLEIQFCDLLHMFPGHDYIIENYEQILEDMKFKCEITYTPVETCSCILTQYHQSK